jgi:SpoVK/Ycf46/Vps4 family AAA+-type ATPase
MKTLTPKMKEMVKKFRENWIADDNLMHDKYAGDDIEQFLIEAMTESKKEVIRDLRRWMKGKEVTKDKVRQWCNGLMEDL